MNIKCPVCHMQVPADHMSLEYQQMHFAFCSAQCRERFEATPHLYIRVPGEKSVKQAGREVIKRRCFYLELPLSQEQAGIVADALVEMMGIREAIVADREIRVTYDLLEATAEQVERTLLKTGARLGNGWKEQLRRSLVHYREDCETANLEVADRGRHSHH